MNQWINDYVKTQKAALDSVPAEAVAKLIGLLRDALKAVERPRATSPRVKYTSAMTDPSIPPGFSTA